VDILVVCNLQGRKTVRKSFVLAYLEDRYVEPFYYRCFPNASFVHVDPMTFNPSKEQNAEGNYVYWHLHTFTNSAKNAFVMLSISYFEKSFEHVTTRQNNPVLVDAKTTADDPERSLRRGVGGSR